MNIASAMNYAAACVCGAEGFVTRAYLDRLAKPPVWTIGYGTTRINGKPVRADMVCTHDQALAWAAEDMRDAADFVLATVHVPLNDWQLAALISFCYNIGVGAFARSSVRSALNAGCYACAAEKLLEYDEAGGVVIGGLETRRKRERAMFLIGNGDPAPPGILPPGATPGAACAVPRPAAPTPAPEPAVPEPDPADLLNQAELDKLNQGTPT